MLFYFLFCEFLTIVFSGEPAHIAVFKEMLIGKFAGIFWFDMILGIVIPFLIIVSKAGRTSGGVGIVSALSFLGVFAERINIVVPSFYHQFLTNDRVLTAYKPTWVEYSLVLGLFAFGTALLIITSKLIPLSGEGKQ